MVGCNRRVGPSERAGERELAASAGGVWRRLSDAEHHRRVHYNTVRPHSSLGYRPPAPENVVPMDQRPMMNYQSNRITRWRSAVLDMLDWTEEKRGTFVENAISVAKNHFSWARVARDTFEAYDLQDRRPKT